MNAIVDPSENHERHSMSTSLSDGFKWLHVSYLPFGTLDLAVSTHQ